MALELLHGGTKTKNKRNNKQCRNSIHYHTETYKKPRKKQKQTETKKKKLIFGKRTKQARIQISICKCVGVNQGLKEPERMNCEQMHIFDKQEEEAGDD